MARPKNPENIYELTCRVTGEKVNTNPQQVNKLLTLYGCNKEDLRNGYVSQRGRNQLRNEGADIATAVVKYNIPENIALKLSVLRPKTKATKIEKDVTEDVKNETSLTEAPFAGETAPEAPTSEEVIG